MKKKFLIVFILIMIYVKVEALSLNLDCQDKHMKIGNTLVCDINLQDENIALTKLSFDYSGNFDMSFQSDDYTISFLDNHVELYFNDVLVSEKIIVGKLSLKSNTKTILGNNNIIISNIRFIDNENNSIDIDDVTENILVENPNLSNDAFLTQIVVDGITVKNFSPNKFEYDDIYVSKQIVFIDAVRHSDKASVTGLGNVRVKPNETITRVLHVTAENGDVIEYHLKITNGIPPFDDSIMPDTISSDNRIKDLNLLFNNEKIDVKFDSAKTVYNVLMPKSNMNKITVIATLSDNKASFIKGYEPKTYNLEYGDNRIELRVKAEDESVLTYTINVTRNDDRSSDFTLSSLVVNNKIINLEENVFDYFIILDHTINKTAIEALPTNEKADVIYQDIDLVDGENDPIIIKVIAENGIAKEYKVNVIRNKEESSLMLESIEVKGHDLSFSLDSYVYNLEIAPNEDKLDIVVNPSTIYQEIIGNSNLQDKSVIIIKITDDTGTSKYTINIHKEVDNDFLLYYAVFGVCVLIFITSIIYAININKKK